MEAGEYCQQTQRVISELCDLLLDILRPPTDPIVCDEKPAASQLRRQKRKVKPTEIASLMLGVSLAMMLCGSVTFVIGFILMPWVIGMVVVLYLVGILSSLSGMAKSILFHGSPSSGSMAGALSPKDMHGQLLSKPPIL